MIKNATFAWRRYVALYSVWNNLCNPLFIACQRGKKVKLVFAFVQFPAGKYTENCNW